METVVAALIGGIGGGVLSFVANLVVAHLNHKRTLERDKLNNDSQLLRDEVVWKRSEMMRIYGRFIEQATDINKRVLSIKEDDEVGQQSMSNIAGSLPVHEVRLVASENVSQVMSKFMLKLVTTIHYRPKNIVDRALKMSSIKQSELIEALQDLENAMRKDIDAQSVGLTAESSIPESESKD
ncbi:hypothetical protein [Arthrobacter sp. AG1021]|uniref:hypothetical protein n=1 Tax=Arthrobacter sp. AG1021 TaxID=2183908 RepID=UPI0011C3B830|nr:hypothetical protein [Arthrobacter sp. AG1021]